MPVGTCLQLTLESHHEKRYDQGHNPTEAGEAKMRLIDSHAHFMYSVPGSDDRAQRALDQAYVDAADRLGIDTLVVSVPMVPKPTTPEIFRHANDLVLDGMRKWPGQIWMTTYVNPGWTQQALAEIDRTLDAHEDVVAVKLLWDYCCSDPVCFPVVEKCIERGLVLIIHQAHLAKHKTLKPHYDVDAADVVALAQRYPEAPIVADHIGGGGDWEWTVKTLAEAPNVSNEISGSGFDEGMLEMQLEYLGADRLVFACDCSISSSVGKFRALPCSEEDRKKIGAENFLRLCGRAQ